MRYCVESSGSSASQQCLIATGEWDYVEDELFATKVIGRAEYYRQPDKTHTVGVRAGCYSLKGGITVTNSCWVDAHAANCILIYQVWFTAPVHKDVVKLESVYYWFKYQGSPACMFDITRIIKLIKSDWF